MPTQWRLKQTFAHLPNPTHNRPTHPLFYEHSTSKPSAILEKEAVDGLKRIRQARADWAVEPPLRSPPVRAQLFQTRSAGATTAEQVAEDAAIAGGLLSDEYTSQTQYW